MTSTSLDSPSSEISGSWAPSHADNPAATTLRENPRPGQTGSGESQTSMAAGGYPHTVGTRAMLFRPSLLPHGYTHKPTTMDTFRMWRSIFLSFEILGHLYLERNHTLLSIVLEMGMVYIHGFPRNLLHLRGAPHIGNGLASRWRQRKTLSIGKHASKYVKILSSTISIAGKKSNNHLNGGYGLIVPVPVSNRE